MTPAICGVSALIVLSCSIGRTEKAALYEAPGHRIRKEQQGAIERYLDWRNGIRDIGP